VKYYRIGPFSAPGWRQLGGPTTLDGKPVDFGLFFQPDPLPYRELAVPIIVDGKDPHYHVAPIEIPVVSEHCLRVMRSVCGPAGFEAIKGRLSNGESVAILHLLSTVDCIDYQASNITFYPDKYPTKELAGKPQYVLRLVIDRSRAAGHHLFRVKDQVAATIMSGELLTELRSSGVEGISVLWEV
jgi:hypothetical protein